MPNPLVPPGLVLPSYAQMKDRARKMMAGTSFDPLPAPDVDVSGNPVEPNTDPIAEGRGAFIPYRGTNFHGVEPMDIGTDERHYGDNAVDVMYDVPDEPDHVLSVRVVSDQKEEINAFRTSQTSIGPNATAVISRQRNRSKVKIKHLGTQTDLNNVRVWVGHNESVSPLNGYPLDAGESMEITSTEIVWMVSSTSVVVPLALWSDFTQDV